MGRVFAVCVTLAAVSCVARAEAQVPDAGVPDASLRDGAATVAPEPALLEALAAEVPAARSADDVANAVSVDARLDHGADTWVLACVDGTTLYLDDVAARRGEQAAEVEAEHLGLAPISSFASELFHWLAARPPVPGPHTGYAVAEAGGTPRCELRLVHLRRAGTALRRVATVALYSFALRSTAPAGCTVRDELRVRDVDGDGKDEVTVIAARVDTPVADVVDGENSRMLEECGAVAFVVAADDLHVQLRVSREYRAHWMDAWQDDVVSRTATWRFADANHDGHPDVHLTEARRTRTTFEDEGSESQDYRMTERHQRVDDRRTLDCPYDAAADTWRCPAAPLLGDALLRDDAAVLATGSSGARRGP